MTRTRVLPVSVVELLDSLAERGYHFEIRGERLRVDPIPDTATVAVLRAEKAVLQSFIAEHGGRWPVLLASAHRYKLWRGSIEDRELSVCIACGIPPLLHGPGALDEAEIVDDYEQVPLVSARLVVPHAACAIVAAEIAARLADLSAGGRLCRRCQKIGRVDQRGVCTFCGQE